MQQLQFGFAPRTKIKFSKLREDLQREKVFDPMPSEEWFVQNLFLTGEIEARKIGGLWWVYQDSVIIWLKAIDKSALAA
jgi:hypothetical protein